MELENRVPTDINRRRLIARLLNIPPVLLGLATLEEITLEPQPPAPVTATRQAKLARVAVDPTPYLKNVRILWQLHDTGSAQDKLGQLYADIRALERCERQARGDLLYQVRETLLGAQILATHIVRDQRRFKRAYYHANQTLRIAKSMDDSDLIATALDTCGWTLVEWGMYGRMEQGVFQVQQDKISAGIRDFEEALRLFPAYDGNESMHPQLLGPLLIKLYRARSMLAISSGERVPASLLIAIDDIADTAGKEIINDPYTRVLLKGGLESWRKVSYLFSRAINFNAAGLAGKALHGLNAAEALTERVYRQDETRGLAWQNIVKANAYMGLEEYGEAAKYARRALLACQDINSITNTAIITDIYGRLLKTGYRASSDVKELGDILRISPAFPLINSVE
jgi:tetratricopeptide (TPR) repeat protein